MRGKSAARCSACGTVRTDTTIRCRLITPTPQDGWRTDSENAARAYRTKKISLEYKPKEPRNHCFLPNVWAALTLIAESGAKNMGVTIDVGHSLEAYENVSEAACAAMSRGRLFHFHMNDNWRLWDDDMIAGSVHTIEFIELFYWLRKLGYSGYISTDQYPYRENSRDAVAQTVKWMQTFEKITERIDSQQMQEILDRNDAVASNELLRRLMFGWLEP